MSSLFQKISIFLLAAACVILIADKTKQSLRLNGVAARIAEKTSELEKERTEFKAVRDKLKEEIRERDRRLRLILLEKAEKTRGLPQPADPQESALARQVSKLGRENTSPGRLSLAFRKFAEEKQLRPDLFRIDPDCGLVVSRAASLLTLAAKSAGMDVKTSLLWDMRSFQPHAVMEILPPDLPDRKIEAASVTMVFSDHPVRTGEERFFLRQDRAQSVIFPFEPVFGGPGEVNLLPPDSLIPCGGLYLHFVEAATPEAWFLEYQFPDEANPKDVNLQAVPLSRGMTVVSHVTDNVKSFLVTPGSGGRAALLIGADRPFFPLRITAVRAGRKLSAEEKELLPQGEKTR